MKLSSALCPRPGGRVYHLDIANGEMPPYVLLPGDPDRVSLLANLLDTSCEIAHHREYHSMKGISMGKEIGICSTGIGGPSTAIAVEELSAIGVDTFLRVGSTGAIKKEISCGDLIISSGAMRLDGTSHNYVAPEYPASANYELTLALIQACEVLGYQYHVGLSASTDSFYAGQGRPSYNGFIPLEKENIVESYASCGILNFEMESSTLFTLANVFGHRAGCICTVFANRITDEFITKGEDKASKAGIEALKILAEWDEEKKKNGKKYFFPNLLK